MKSELRLKSTKLEEQAVAFLRELLAPIPFVELKSSQHDVRIVQDNPARPDALLSLEVDKKEWLLVVEVKNSGQPRIVRTALLQLEQYQALCPSKRCYSVFVAPFISEESARICREAGVGYADLAGNAWLSFGNVFIDIRVAENPFREQRENRSLFSPKAARILRVLLHGPLQPWKVTALAAEADVSLGLVSIVRRQLIEREWAAEEAEGVLITKPDLILDAWAASDDWKGRTTVRQYSLLVTEPQEIAERLKSVLGSKKHAFTQWFAGWLRHPYTVPTVVTAYIDEFPDEMLLEKQLLARRVSEGGRLWLVKPQDAGVFQGVQTIQGFTLASDVQIYLDLLQSGLRGDEQAAELRKWDDFSGGWR